MMHKTEIRLHTNEQIREAIDFALAEAEGIDAEGGKWAAVFTVAVNLYAQKQVILQEGGGLLLGPNGGLPPA